MRQMVVVLTIALSVAGVGREAAAQTIASGAAARPLTRAVDEAIKREASQMARFPGPHRSARCCNMKGAAIGAAVGAGLGFGVVATQCRGFGCAPYAARAAGILGGIGATIGIFM